MPPFHEQIHILLFSAFIILHYIFIIYILKSLLINQSPAMFSIQYPEKIQNLKTPQYFPETMLSMKFVTMRQNQSNLNLTASWTPISFFHVRKAVLK